MCLYNHEGGFFEPEFFEPQEWRTEDPESIEATNQLFDVILGLVRCGYKVDLIDTWAEDDSQLFELEVDLAVVTRESFHMFEDYVMRFK
jgi:hypothetical protein